MGGLHLDDLDNNFGVLVSKEVVLFILFDWVQYIFYASH